MRWKQAAPCQAQHCFFFSFCFFDPFMFQHQLEHCRHINIEVKLQRWRRPTRVGARSQTGNGHRLGGSVWMLGTKRDLTDCPQRLWDLCFGNTESGRESKAEETQIEQGGPFQAMLAFKKLNCGLFERLLLCIRPPERKNTATRRASHL